MFLCRKICLARREFETFLTYKQNYRRKIMKKSKILFITQTALIAAIYVVLVIAFQPISSGAVQVRIAECLTILPFFTPAAVPGLTIGCFLANLLSGSSIFDIIFGTLATLIGAVGSHMLRRHKFLVPLPPIISNMIIVPLVLNYAFAETMPLWLLSLSIGAGELISCGVLGMVLLFALKKLKLPFQDPSQAP